MWTCLCRVTLPLGGLDYPTGRTCLWLPGQWESQNYVSSVAILKLEMEDGRTVEVNNQDYQKGNISVQYEPLAITQSKDERGMNGLPLWWNVLGCIANESRGYEKDLFSFHTRVTTTHRLVMSNFPF